MMMIVFFFFKQKTAYEMRISDWSSDVCSSDLFSSDAPPFRPRGEREQELTLIELYAAIHHPGSTGINPPRLVSEFHARLVRALSLPFLPQIGRASCRERVCQDV